MPTPLDMARAYDAAVRRCDEQIDQLREEGFAIADVVRRRLRHIKCARALRVLDAEDLTRRFHDHEALAEANAS